MVDLQEGWHVRKGMHESGARCLGYRKGRGWWPGFGRVPCCVMAGRLGLQCVYLYAQHVCRIRFHVRCNSTHGRDSAQRKEVPSRQFGVTLKQLCEAGTQYRLAYLFMLPSTPLGLPRNKSLRFERAPARDPRALDRNYNMRILSSSPWTSNIYLSIVIT